MRLLLFVLFISISTASFASEANRFLNPGKVLYEEPQEDDILKVQTAIGYTTVLEFSEKPTMVTTGDSELLQIEVPKNSRNVLIKPLFEIGETNLFVFTPNQRFNYKVIIGDEQDVDYVIDVKEAFKKIKQAPKNLPLREILKKTQNYTILKESGQLDRRNFIQKDIFAQYDNANVRVDIIEAFANKNPHYLIVHIVVHNKQYTSIKLVEKNTNVYVNGEKFVPAYVVFDAQKLNARQKTDGWLILEDTYVSLDNEFKVGVGIHDKEYIL